MCDVFASNDEERVVSTSPKILVDYKSPLSERMMLSSTSNGRIVIDLGSFAEIGVLIRMQTSSSLFALGGGRELEDMRLYKIMIGILMKFNRFHIKDLHKALKQAYLKNKNVINQAEKFVDLWESIYSDHSDDIRRARNSIIQARRMCNV